MSCSNCYNGCTQITSDQCVRYTGIDIPVLGIKTGDSLSYVEQAIIEFLVSTLDGSGIIIDTAQLNLCTLVTSNLPTCGDISVVDVLNALVKSVCSLQTQITTIDESIISITAELDEINGPYTIPSCLEGLTSSSTTHQVLQNIIDSFCGFVQTAGFIYVKIGDLDALIADYLQRQQVSDKYYTKMVPYVAMELYPIPGILNNFDNTGAGISGTIWEKIYLCNGLNGTPDKRGVVAVGVTDGTMLGNPMNPLVNPSTPGNPTYTYAGGIVGANGIQLSTNNMPSHTHTNTATSPVTDPGHTHNFTYLDKGNPGNGTATIDLTGPSTFTTASSITGITVNTTVTINPAGGDQPHNNYQPGIGCYYIMYIP
jgi:microcystin-dependent protein